MTINGRDLTEERILKRWAEVAAIMEDLIHLAAVEVVDTPSISRAVFPVEVVVVLAVLVSNLGMKASSCNLKTKLFSFKLYSSQNTCCILSSRKFLFNCNLNVYFI